MIYWLNSSAIFFFSSCVFDIPLNSILNNLLSFWNITSEMRCQISTDRIHRNELLFLINKSVALHKWTICFATRRYTSINIYSSIGFNRFSRTRYEVNVIIHTRSNSSPLDTYTYRYDTIDYISMQYFTVTSIFMNSEIQSKRRGTISFAVVNFFFSIRTFFKAYNFSTFVPINRLGHVTKVSILKW